MRPRIISTKLNRRLVDLHKAPDMFVPRAYQAAPQSEVITYCFDNTMPAIDYAKYHKPAKDRFVSPRSKKITKRYKPTPTPLLLIRQAH